MNRHSDKIAWLKFVDLVDQAGLTPRKCQENHWQIIGGLHRVNVWPFAKGGLKFYVDRAVRLEGGARHGTVEDAIKAAGPSPAVSEADTAAPWEERAERPVGLVRRFWRWFW